MRDGWIETNLEGIAEYINGYPFKPADLGENGVPVIRIKQLLDPNEPVDKTEIETPERCLLRNGDIVFSWSGTLAVRIWNRGPAKLNQHLFRVVEKEGVYKGIIPLILDHAIEELEEKSHGTTMKHITKQTLLPHKVLLPPLPEQKRIVDFISSVDSYIESLQQQLENAKRSRNAVLHELVSSTSDEDTKPLIELAKLQRGHDLPTQDRIQGSIPVVASNGVVGFHNTHKATRPGVITGRSGTIGKVIYIDNDYWPLNTTLYVVDFKGNVPKFVALVLETLKLENYAGGSTVPSLDRNVLSHVPVPCPKIEEQVRVVEIIQSFDENVAKSELAIAEARNLRSGLLTDLLSGEHEIPASYDNVMGAA